jgi:hypothetical protein
MEQRRAVLLRGGRLAKTSSAFFNNLLIYPAVSGAVAAIDFGMSSFPAVYGMLREI